MLITILFEKVGFDTAGNDLSKAIFLIILTPGVWNTNLMCRVRHLQAWQGSGKAAEPTANKIDTNNYDTLESNLQGGRNLKQDLTGNSE